MPPSRRVWCSCVIIDFLVGAPRFQPHGIWILEAAVRGDTEIIVSTLAECEVARVGEELPDEAERMIREFFGRPYILRANLDPPVAEIARDLVRKFKIRGADAAHVATAIHWGIPVFETVDEPLLTKINNRLNEDPGLLPGRLIVRKPFWEGQQPLIGLVPPAQLPPENPNE